MPVHHVSVILSTGDWSMVSFAVPCHASKEVSIMTQAESPNASAAGGAGANSQLQSTDMQ